MSTLGSKSKGSSLAKVHFLDLCKFNVRSIEDLVDTGNLLNQRQCFDLSSKLSKTSLNIRELVLHCGASADLFRPALENLYRYLEKARLLVNECGEEEWWTVAVVQSLNENAFREILLDVSLCYNAIYEQARSIHEDSSILPEDLRESSVFRHATDNDIHRDQQDLRKRLEDLAYEPSGVSVWDQLLTRVGSIKQYLARYLLVKLNCRSVQSQVNTLDTCSAIIWAKESEPSGTWGNYRLLGAGAGSSGVCSTKWMGIPCAKKEFHDQESEEFFLKEAGILACLKHPCIVNFFCCGNGEERGDRFIAMELMEKSLSKSIEEQKNEYFSLPVVVEIMVQMARGMRYLHDQGVAHRDLKPQNVVVNRLTSPHLLDHFSVKLVDFGMSKTKVEASKSNTVTAVGIGTTMYRAPEVHPDANPDGKGKVNWFKADVFSYSMTCAHLLSLRRPFGDMERLRELYKELMNGRRPKLPQKYPKELVALLRECWDSNPCSRPSFMEICRRLEMFRHIYMRGFSSVDEGLQKGQQDMDTGFDFIKSVICLKSSIPRPGAVESKLEREIQDMDAVRAELEIWMLHRDEVPAKLEMEMQDMDSEMPAELEMQMQGMDAVLSALREAPKKREDTEATKFMMEGILSYQRGLRKRQAYIGYNCGPPMRSPSNGGDQQGSMVGHELGSPKNSNAVFPTFASPSSQDESASEVLGEVPAIKLPAGEKWRKARVSSKIGPYFGK